MRDEGRQKRADSLKKDAICHRKGVSPNWWGPSRHRHRHLVRPDVDSNSFHRMRVVRVPCAIPDLGWCVSQQGNLECRMAFHDGGLPLWPCLPLGNISPASSRPAPTWNEKGRMTETGRNVFLMLVVTISAKVLKQRRPDAHHWPCVCKA